MSNSYSSAFYHIVFAVKFRKNCFPKSIRPEVYKIIAYILKDEHCEPIVVGGHSDHIHILTSIKPRFSISDILAKVKSRSNKWLKQKKLVDIDFEWQIGYGLFTVSFSHIKRIKKYIQHQDLHHQEKIFEDEFIELLIENNINYDKRYLLKPED